MKKSSVILFSFIVFLIVLSLFWVFNDEFDSYIDNGEEENININIDSERPEIDESLPKTDIFFKITNSNRYRIKSEVEDIYYRVITETMIINDNSVEFYLPLPPEGLKWFGIATQKFPATESEENFNPINVEHKFVSGKTNLINFNRSEAEFIAIVFSFDGEKSSMRGLTVEILPNDEVLIFK